jgi:hypothetical protein
MDTLGSPTVPDGCMETRNGRPQQQDGWCFPLGQPGVVIYGGYDGKICSSRSESQETSQFQQRIARVQSVPAASCKRPVSSRSEGPRAEDTGQERKRQTGKSEPQIRRNSPVVVRRARRTSLLDSGRRRRNAEEDSSERRMVSSGLLRHVALVRTDVSEELAPPSSW